MGEAPPDAALNGRSEIGLAAIVITMVTGSEQSVPATAECLRALPGVEIYESAHPLPDARSIAAGERLLRWTQELPHDVQPLFLISGGASSLVEVLAPGVTLLLDGGGREPGPDDVLEILNAAGPLLEELARRRLCGDDLK